MKRRWPLNGNATATLGAVVVALLTLFAFLNGNPFALKSEVAAFKTDLQTQLGEIRQDVREIRKFLIGGGDGGRR